MRNHGCTREGMRLVLGMSLLSLLLLCLVATSASAAGNVSFTTDCDIFDVDGEKYSRLRSLNNQSFPWEQPYSLHFDFCCSPNETAGSLVCRQNSSGSAVSNITLAPSFLFAGFLHLSNTLLLYSDSYEEALNLVPCNPLRHSNWTTDIPFFWTFYYPINGTNTLYNWTDIPALDISCSDSLVETLTVSRYGLEIGLPILFGGWIFWTWWCSRRWERSSAHWHSLHHARILVLAAQMWILLFLSIRTLAVGLTPRGTVVYFITQPLLMLFPLAWMQIRSKASIIIQMVFQFVLPWPPWLLWMFIVSHAFVVDFPDTLVFWMVMCLGFNVVLFLFASMILDAQTDISPYYHNPTYRRLCYLLGWTGAHRFYAKQYWSGVGYLITFGGGSLGWIVDAIAVMRFQPGRSPFTVPAPTLNSVVSRVLCYGFGILGVHHYYWGVNVIAMGSHALSLVVAQVCSMVVFEAYGIMDKNSLWYLGCLPWIVPWMFWFRDMFNYPAIWADAQSRVEELRRVKEENEELKEQLLGLSASGDEWDIRPTDLTRQKLIGRGATSIVYAGTWKGRVQVAIKELLTSNCGGAGGLSQMIQEARIHSRLRHSNILILIGVTVPPQGSKENACIVTELMQRGSLFHCLTERTTSRERSFVGGIAMDILSGLDYLYSRGILHRDLKSLNVLINEHWQAKLSDFGTSRLQVAALTNKLVGTTRWCAPEVFEGQQYSFASDVWSFGTVLLELSVYSSTGTYSPPYGEEVTEFDVRAALIAGLTPLHVIALRTLEEDLLLTELSANSTPVVKPFLQQSLDPKMIDLLMRIFSKDPEQRPTVSQLLLEVPPLFGITEEV